MDLVAFDPLPSIKSVPNQYESRKVLQVIQPYQPFHKRRFGARSQEYRNL